MNSKTKEAFEDLINSALEIEKQENEEILNSDEFEIKFKNLLAFICILVSVNESVSDIKIKEVDYDYIIEKYIYYIKNGSRISDEEKKHVIEFSTTLKKIFDVDSLISKWEYTFGIDSLFNISSSLNYKKGLHPILKINIFDKYIEKFLPKSRKYKIWKTLK